MTDKEQIKAIIKQYADKGKTLYRECCDDNESASLINYWDGYRDCAYNLLRELDDMQEECNITGTKSKHATGKLKELVDNVSEKGLEEACKQLEELTKECMYSKDNYTDEDRKVLCEGCEEECRFNKKDEIKSVHAQHTTISSSLNDYLCKAYNALYKENGGRLSFARLQNMAIDITEWQKEQLLAKAVEGKVLANGMGNPILHLWDKGKHLIDKKVKVIVIKKD